MSRPQRLSEPGEPDQGFLDNLAAAIRFKSFLVGRGSEVDPKVLEELEELWSVFRKEIELRMSPDPVQAERPMECPTVEASMKLNNAIKSLARTSDGLALDAFRPDNLDKAQETEQKIRNTLFWCGAGFAVILTLSLVVPPIYPSSKIMGVIGWAISLGGIGSVAGLFVQVLKIAPHESLRTDDLFTVQARIFLGLAFSLVLTIVLATDDLLAFFAYLSNIGEAGNDASRLKVGILLLPFLCGFSVPFVLGLLDKAMQAIQLTIGMELRGPSRDSRRR